MCVCVCLPEVCLSSIQSGADSTLNMHLLTPESVCCLYVYMLLINLSGKLQKY